MKASIVVGFVIPGFSIAWQYSGIGRITPFRLNEFAGIGRICLPGGPFGGSALPASKAVKRLFHRAKGQGNAGKGQLWAIWNLLNSAEPGLSLSLPAKTMFQTSCFDARQPRMLVFTLLGLFIEPVKNPTLRIQVIRLSELS